VVKNPKPTSGWRSWLALVPAIGVTMLPRFT
jgi:hypothetical protein